MTDLGLNEIHEIIGLGFKCRLLLGTQGQLVVAHASGFTVSPASS